MNIAKTLFVCIVLTLGAIFFNNDTNRLVLIPIERMVARVRRIAKNPLAVSEEDPTDILTLEKDADNKKSCWGKMCSNSEDEHK